MARYDYRCPGCGVFELRFPIGTASGQAACPSCGRAAARLISAPYLRQVHPGVGRALLAEEKSRDQPDVVRTVPGRPRPAPAPHPALARLPKP
jgi:putative FmdB family regulatory protein